MSSRALEAARRLASQLPAREHRLMDDCETRPERPSHNACAVEIDGTVYASIELASRAYGLTRPALNYWLKKGRAKRV